MRVTVQVAEAPDASEAGAQLKLDGTVSATRVTEEVADEPLRVAVTTAAPSAVTVPAVAVKVAVATPAATVTEAGTVRAALLSESVTSNPPVGAIFLRVTVQMAAAPDASEAGAQVRVDGTIGATRVNVEVAEEPFSAAVTTAAPSAVTVPAVAVKVAVATPAATVTEAGTVRAALLSESVTRNPPVGAIFLRVTVQMAAAPDASEAGAQVRVDGTIGATRVNVEAAEEPFSAAVTTAAPSAVTVPAVAVKVAVATPAATVTEAGTVRAALLSESVTSNPPVGAIFLRVTVQMAAAPDASEAGAQLRVDGTIGATRVTEEVAEEPLRVAVTTAEPSAVTVPAVAAKVAVATPAATVTEAGTVRAALLSESVTSNPPVGAIFLRVTVQMAAAPDASEAGAQVRVDGTIGATRVNDEVAEEPFRAAVTTAAPSAVTVPAVAAKVAVATPAATVTEAGTVRAALLSESVTSNPPVGAIFLRVTVQMAAAPDASEAGAQVRVDGTIGATRVNVEVAEEPFRAAVTTAAPSAVTVPAVAAPAVAAKVAVATPAATVTEAGTVRAALLSESVTSNPPVGAIFLRVTVQMAAAPDASEAGAQVRVDGTIGATRVNDEVAEEPFRAAVTTAAPSAVTVPAVAVKVAVATPAATVTEAGTVRAALLSESVTSNPPVGAIFLRVTVQMAAAPDASEAGAQVRVDGTIGATRVTEEVAEEPLRVAVTTAEPSAVTVPAVAEGGGATPAATEPRDGERRCYPRA
ncbi:MAG: hypothetical protein IPP47_28075 [Bryobacterales bacterium]|nr:hypothetical protein [Bryobacterales bacterium]